MSLDELLSKKDELKLNLDEAKVVPKPTRRNRYTRMSKSRSAGVSAMRQNTSFFQGVSISNKKSKDDSLINNSKSTDMVVSKPRSRGRLRRTTSAPQTILQMRDGVEKLGSSTQTTTKTPRKNQRNSSSTLPSLIEDIPAHSTPLKKLNEDRGSVLESVKNEKEVDFHKTNGVKTEDITLPSQDAQNSALKESEKKTLSDRICAYLETSTYRLLSFAFGSMWAFFLLGMRMEVLLIKEKELKDTYNTFHFDLYKSFWLLFMWLICFTVEGVTFIAYFMRDKDKTHLTYAGMFGFFNGILCLTTFIIAETQRSDGPFGSRKVGGVGLIEPLVALLLLRELRWPFGEWM